MSYVILEPEYLEVNGIPLSTPAWRLLDLSALLDLPPVRGENEIIPGVEGRDPLAHFFDENVLQFPIEVTGDAAPDGEAYEDPMLGWQTNVELLTEGLGFGLTTGDGTVPAIWHRRDDTTRTAAVQPIPPLGPLNIDDLPNTVTGMLELKVPLGRFLDAGS